jgi:hypothetical protein
LLASIGLLEDFHAPSMSFGIEPNGSGQCEVHGYFIFESDWWNVNNIHVNLGFEYATCNSKEYLPGLHCIILSRERAFDIPVPVWHLAHEGSEKRA